jgi:hypothetical protein
MQTGNSNAGFIVIATNRIERALKGLRLRLRPTEFGASLAAWRGTIGDVGRRTVWRRRAGNECGQQGTKQLFNSVLLLSHQTTGIEHEHSTTTTTATTLDSAFSMATGSAAYDYSINSSPLLGLTLLLDRNRSPPLRHHQHTTPRHTRGEWEAGCHLTCPSRLVPDVFVYIRIYILQRYVYV